MLLRYFFAPALILTLFGCQTINVDLPVEVALEVAEPKLRFELLESLADEGIRASKQGSDRVRVRIGTIDWGEIKQVWDSNGIPIHSTLSAQVSVQIGSQAARIMRYERGVPARTVQKKRTFWLDSYARWLARQLAESIRIALVHNDADKR